MERVRDWVECDELTMLDGKAGGQEEGELTSPSRVRVDTLECCQTTSTPHLPLYPPPPTTLHTSTWLTRTIPELP